MTYCVTSHIRNHPQRPWETKMKRKHSHTFAQDWTNHWAKCVFSCHNKAANVCLLMCVNFCLFTSETSINRPNYFLLTSVFSHHFPGKIKGSRWINKHEQKTYYLKKEKRNDGQAHTNRSLKKRKSIVSVHSQAICYVEIPLKSCTLSTRRQQSDTDNKATLALIL